MPIGGVSNNDKTTTQAEVPAPSRMDKEAFLKLLVAQLRHQDPLKPMEGTEFVTQLAQFSSVEQQLLQSAKLDLLSLQMGGIANNEAAALVGKQVTVRGKSSQAYDGVTNSVSNYTLDSDAAKVTVQVRDEKGNVVRTMVVDNQKAGANSVTWDGTTDAGGKASSGTYTFEVKATDKDGKEISTHQEVTGIVVKVAFDKGYAELVLDSGVRVPLSDLISVASPSGPNASPNGPGNVGRLNAAVVERVLQLISEQ